jgi:hypothetical protein
MVFNGFLENLLWAYKMHILRALEEPLKNTITKNLMLFLVFDWLTIMIGSSGEILNCISDFFLFRVGRERVQLIYFEM